MNRTTPSSELAHRLRQATKQPHHVLDHHPLMAPLVRRDLSLAQYGNALAALHGVQVRAEEAILAFLEKHPGDFDYRTRRKLPSLEADLAALGREPARVEPDFPVPHSIGALVGILYVIEGSANGGRLIARLLRELPLANLPTAFFDGYGELARQRWEEFLRFAEAGCSPQEQEIALATAVQVFEAITRHMDACLGPFRPA